MKSGFFAKLKRLFSKTPETTASAPPVAPPPPPPPARPPAPPRDREQSADRPKPRPRQNEEQRPRRDDSAKAAESRSGPRPQRERPPRDTGKQEQERERGGRPPRGRREDEELANYDRLSAAAPRRLEFPAFPEWEVPPPKPVEGDDKTVYFQNLPIHPRVLKALLVDLGFDRCTEIQGMALPHTLAGLDVAGRAQTGTGKTAAFLISIFTRLLAENPERAPHQPFALCIAPTRELAIQIEHDAALIGKYCGLRTLAVYGGMDYDRQRNQIAAGVDLVAATPGRLLDYVQKKAIDLSKVKVMVIDEADRMLDMGFIPDVRRIISRLCRPEGRQTLLFSATLDQTIMELAKNWMRPNPVVLATDPEQMVAPDIEEIIYAISVREKLPLLLWLLKTETWSRVLIFRNQRFDVERLYHDLHRHGIHCEMLSGDVPQKKRLHILEAFRKGDIPVVVATDVAGRGIHVEDISHVINYDFPFEAEDYVHRIGRTGRAGHAGKAISFAGDDCAFVIPEIEEYVGRSLPTIVPTAEMVEAPPAPKGEHGEKIHPRRPAADRPANRRPSGPRRPRPGGKRR
ncbi:MAG: DEAD/DEAH box helicase [Lentisphaeria bacterium]|nr:DEAD/DEAH box helicase [Lentisphaeria bacterium]